MSVAVIGAGMMGASVAWHLARLGSRVVLIDSDLTGRGGVTASSYGWVGAADHLPSDDPTGFALRQRAVAEFARLERELGALPIAARGALGWCWTEAETAALIAEQRAAGVRVEGVGRAAMAEHAPRLARPPALGAWSPDDFAVEAGMLARQLIAGASAAGATTRQAVAESIETTNGHVVGVNTAEGRIPADVVVLANGFGAQVLASRVGVYLPLRESPAVLIRLTAQPGLVRPLIYGSGLEVRPALDGSLVCAADYPPEARDGLSALGVRTAAGVADLLGLASAPAVLSVNAAHRPMTSGGTPLQEFVGGVAGLYALVAHPGVILAPLLGRLAAAEIVSA